MAVLPTNAPAEKRPGFWGFVGFFWLSQIQVVLCVRNASVGIMENLLLKGDGKHWKRQEKNNFLLSC